MKRLWMIVPTVLVVLLTSCSTEAGIDTKETATALLASGAFSEELEVLDETIATALYYLDATVVTEAIVYASTGATAEELAVITVADSGDVQGVVDAFTWRVESQTMVLTNYQPSEVPKLEAATITQVGNTVILVVANQPDLANQLLP